MARRTWSWSVILVPLGVLASGLTCSRSAIAFIADGVAAKFCTTPACHADVNDRRALAAVIGLLSLAVLLGLLAHAFRRHRAPQ